MTVRLAVERGAVDEPLIEHSIDVALRRAAVVWPEREAIVSCAEGRRLTWREMDAQVNRLAAGLLAIGLEPGDRIAIWAPNSIAWTLLQFATARARLIFVTFNTAFKRGELQHVLDLSGARAIVCVPGYKDIDYARELSAVTAPSLVYRIMLAPSPPAGWLPFECLFDSDSGRLDGDEARATEVCNIQFTSGTTGRAKGVALTHRNILNNGYAVGKRMGLRVGDRLCIPVPLFHCFGMVMGNLACVTHGATMIYPDHSFSAQATLDALFEEECTHCHGVPTMFIAMLEALTWSHRTFTALRGGIMAGSTCPEVVMRRVMERMNMREVTIAYGMTETSPVSAQSNTQDDVGARVTTVGQVLPHLEIKIVDASGAIVPRGAAGEFCTRGYSVMSGYWGDPAATSNIIDADGFVHSGDVASMDEDGFVAISGRLKDLIIRGGENISPRDVEEQLLRHPAVLNATVVGVPDERFGEIVAAWIIPANGMTPTEDDIRAFCRQNMAHYKVPAIVRIVTELPVTSSGKIQKFKIREAEINRATSRHATG